MRKAIVDEDTDLCPGAKVGGHERRIAKLLIKVFVNDAAFIKNRVPIDQGGYFPVGADLQEFGSLLLGFVPGFVEIRIFGIHA